MSKNEEEYDSASQTIRVFRAFGKPKTLVPNDEIQRWIGALKEGKTSGGESLKNVEYVFEDEATAEYNQQALAFAGLKTAVGNRKKRKPYESEDGSPSFGTREDFGID
ncbi:MAG: hypothetical protein ACNA8W_12430 [Bradymonadaceae bacterium]